MQKQEGGEMTQKKKKKTPRRRSRQTEQRCKQMIQENKKKILVSIVLLLFPIVIGLCVWNRLPMQIPTRWNADGSVDSWEDRIDIVFKMPVSLLVIHNYVVFVFSKDLETKEGRDLLWGFGIWIAPNHVHFMRGCHLCGCIRKTNDNTPLPNRNTSYFCRKSTLCARKIR